MIFAKYNLFNRRFEKIFFAEASAVSWRAATPGLNESKAHKFSHSRNSKLEIRLHFTDPFHFSYYKLDIREIRPLKKIIEKY